VLPSRNFIGYAKGLAPVLWLCSMYRDKMAKFNQSVSLCLDFGAHSLSRYRWSTILVLRLIETSMLLKTHLPALVSSSVVRMDFCDSSVVRMDFCDVGIDATECKLLVRGVADGLHYKLGVGVRRLNVFRPRKLSLF